MNKKKGILVAIIFLLLIYPTMVGANYLDSLLGQTKPPDFRVAHQIRNLSAVKNARIFFFLMLGIILLFLLYLLVQNYFSIAKSDTVEIMPDFIMPKPVGENQYGSSWWLARSKFDKEFTSFSLSKKNPYVKYLAEIGRYDLSDDYDSVLDELIDFAPFKSGGLVINQAKRLGSYRFHAVTTDTHTLTLGATRSSKTRNLVLPSIIISILAGENIVVTDIKGELYHYCYPLLKRLGYEVIVIDYDNPKKSDGNNLMQRIINALVKKDIIEAKSLTNNLVEMLVGEYEGHGEKLWSDGEKAVMACCIMAVAYDNREQPKLQNLTNVYHFIHRMCRPIDDKTPLPLETYLNTIPENHPAKALAGASDIAYTRTKSSFYTSAIATLRLFADDYVADITSRTTMDIDTAGYHKQAVFIILPEERTEYYSMASLFVYQHSQILVRNAKAKGGRLPIRTHFYLDEVGNFTKMIAFDTFLTLFGGRGISFHLFLQSLEQLVKTYGDSVSKILSSNCETWVYLQSDDGDTKEAFSKKLGTYTMMTPTVSTSTTGEASGSTGYSYGERRLLIPDELGRVKRPYQIVTSRTYPAICKSPDISQTIFNDFLGLGDEEHNLFVILKRSQNRPERIIREPVIWDIASRYSPFYLKTPSVPMRAGTGKEVVEKKDTVDADWIIKNN